MRHRKLRSPLLAFGLLGLTLGAGCDAGSGRSAESTPIAAAPRGMDGELRRFFEDCGTGRRHVKLSHDPPLSDQQREALIRAGVKLLCDWDDKHYAVSIPCRLPFIDPGIGDLVERFTPQEKVAHQFRLDPASQQFQWRALPRWALDQGSPPIKILVQFFSDVEPDDFEVDLAGIGLKGAGSQHGTTSWELAVRAGDLKDIWELDSVKFIQPGPTPFSPLVDESRAETGTDGVQVFVESPYGYTLSGAGVHLGVCDDGLDQKNQDFRSVTGTGQLGPTRVSTYSEGYKYMKEFTNPHATHVAAIAAGNGFNSEFSGLKPFQLRGHAPRVKIGDYPHFNSKAKYFRDAIVSHGVDATNHSYVQSFVLYDIHAFELDLLVRGDATFEKIAIPARAQVWGAGNNGIKAQYDDELGYFSVFSSAKNTIGVGSIDTRNGRLSRFSSLGPTFDGRIKPDLVAPGCRESVGEKGIRVTGNLIRGYEHECGTSMAAPVVTGIIALMMEAYRETYGVPPKLLPSTYKSLLLNTARDLIKESPVEGDPDNHDTGSPVLYHRGPDFATGYGLVRADAAVEAVRSGNWREGTIGSAGDRDTFCVSVPPRSGELKLTLAWDDLPGCHLNDQVLPKLVNDLDLRLVMPAQGEIFPWTLPPLQPTPNPGSGGKDPISAADVQPAQQNEADRRNNVEQTSVPGPQAGIWKAKITGHRLPLTSQTYSLSSSHAFVRCPQSEDVEVCQRLPWICEVALVDRVRPYRDVLNLDPRLPVPIDRICHFADECPPCSGYPWERCEPWTLQLSGIPRRARIVVIDERGRVVHVDDTGGAVRRIPIGPRSPGERHFAAIADPSWDAYPEPLELSYRVETAAAK